MSEIVKWEYTLIHVRTRELQAQLTRYGLEGWQVASIVFPAVAKAFFAVEPRCTIVFQRPMTEVRYPRVQAEI